MVKEGSRRYRKKLSQETVEKLFDDLYNRDVFKKLRNSGDAFSKEMAENVGDIKKMFVEAYKPLLKTMFKYSGRAPKMDSGELLQKIGGRASSEIESYKDLKSYVYDLIACGITGAGLGFFTVGGPMGVACALAALASSGGISLFDILKHRIKYRHIHKVNRKYGSVEEVIKRLSSAYNEAVSYSDSTS